MLVIENAGSSAATDFSIRSTRVKLYPLQVWEPTTLQPLDKLEYVFRAARVPYQGSPRPTSIPDEAPFVEISWASSLLSSARNSFFRWTGVQLLLASALLLSSKLIAAVVWLTRRERVRLWLPVAVVIVGFLVTRYFASYHHINLPENLWFPPVGRLCPPESRRLIPYAINWGGVLIPVIVSLLLAAKFLRGKSLMLWLGLTALAAGFAAYNLSELGPGGIDIRWGWVGLLAGALAAGGTIPIEAPNLWNIWRTQVNLRGVTQELWPIITSLFPRAIAVGYISGVGGTLIGGDILHTCELLAVADAVEMGGDGIWDAIYLAGFTGALIAAACYALVWVLAWSAIWPKR